MVELNATAGARSQFEIGALPRNLWGVPSMHIGGTALFVRRPEARPAA